MTTLYYTAGSGSKSHTELYGAHTSTLPLIGRRFIFLTVSPHTRRTYLTHAHYGRTQLTDLPLGVAAHFCFIAMRVYCSASRSNAHNYIIIYE